MIYKQEFLQAKKILIEAGEKLINEKNLELISSNGKDTKAKADIETESFILNRIKEISSFSILSEESCTEFRQVIDEPYWILDPIDGTLNYTREIPISCISIALWNNSLPIFGIIYDFNCGEIISGYSNMGAWLNDLEITLPAKSLRSQSILGTGISTYINLENDRGSLEDFIEKIVSYKKVRILGSAALSVAYVALNRFNAYLEKDIKLWDVAGGISIISALGIPYKMDRISDFGYNVFIYNHD